MLRKSREMERRITGFATVTCSSKVVSTHGTIGQGHGRDVMEVRDGDGGTHGKWLGRVSRAESVRYVAVKGIEGGVQLVVVSTGGCWLRRAETTQRVNAYALNCNTHQLQQTHHVRPAFNYKAPRYTLNIYESAGAILYGHSGSATEIRPRRVSSRSSQTA